MTGTPAREEQNTHPFADGVIRRSDLVAAGHTNHSLSTRCRPGGPWQSVLPGVVLLANSPPNRRQRLKAAVLYAGKEAVITGSEALREHEVSAIETTEVHLLLPANRRLSAREFVRVERTSRMPNPRIVNGLPFAPPHRAAVDAARTPAIQPTNERYCSAQSKRASAHSTRSAGSWTPAPNAAQQLCAPCSTSPQPQS
jgi:hypothetical protein